MLPPALMPLRLVVGQRTLNPLGEVRILEGQPYRLLDHRSSRSDEVTSCGRIRRLQGDVVKWFNTEVCKTSIHRFESGRRLQLSRTQPCDLPDAQVAPSGQRQWPST